MTNILVSTKNMDRNEWLSWRNRGIGGSDASVVCGINKYKSPMQLWLEKTDQIEPEVSGEAAYWGTIMEPIVKKEFTLRSGMKIKNVPFLMQHPEYEFMLANVDGMVNDKELGKCVFEAKTASVFKQNGWLDSIPDEYMLQVQHYLAVTGYKAAYVAVLIGGNKFDYILIKRDDELINLLIKIESDFWNHVKTNTPPPIDGSDASTRLLNKLFNIGNKGSRINLPDEALDIIITYENYLEKERNAALEKEKVTNQLKQMLGNNEIGIIGDREVAWKNVTTERFDTKGFKADYPDTHKKYSSPSESRRFSIKSITNI
jgi:putative phage-type endonuclease